MPLRVYIFCEGRLANQLLSWANGRYVTRNLPNRQLLLCYPPLEGKCTLPNTQFIPKSMAQTVCQQWPKATTAQLAGMNRDCYWTEAWINHPAEKVMLEQLDEMQISSRIWDQVADFTHQNTKKFIGVHIRYGDYVPIDEQNPPAVRPTFPRAPNRYYSEVLDQCLTELPDHAVFLCTDAEDSEVAWFTEKYHSVSQPKNDGLLDLLTLARCKIIIASASTFSPLAASLGGKPYIHPETSPEDVKRVIQSVKAKL
jgi:hypothetical protein